MAAQLGGGGIHAAGGPREGNEGSGHDVLDGKPVGESLATAKVTINQ